MKNETFLKLLGYRQLAALTGTTESAVANWKTRGVPWRHKRAVSLHAAERLIELPEGYWDGRND